MKLPWKHICALLGVAAVGLTYQAVSIRPSATLPVAADQPSGQGQENQRVQGSHQSEIVQKLKHTTSDADPVIVKQQGALTNGGMLSSDIIDLLGLDVEEQIKINQALTEWQGKLTDLVRSHIQDLTPGRGPTCLGAFSIKPFPSEGAGAFDALAKRIGTTLDKDRSALLIKAINTSNRFAASGRHSVNMEILSVSESPSGAVMVSIVEKDEKGATKRQSLDILSEINARYGTDLRIGN